MRIRKNRPHNCADRANNTHHYYDYGDLESTVAANHTTTTVTTTETSDDSSAFLVKRKSMRCN